MTGPNTVVALHFGQGEVKVLGTDGFKIFCDRIPCTAPKHAFTFAFEACAELARLGKGGVSVKKRGDDLTFQQNRTKLTLRGLKRTFPNYPRVLTWQVYGDTVFETEPVRAFLLDAAKLNRHQNRRVDLRVLAGTPAAQSAGRTPLPGAGRVAQRRLRPRIRRCRATG